MSRNEASITELKALQKYYNLKIKAIEALIPVIQTFDGKKPYKNTFNPAAEAAFDGIDVSYSRDYGITVQYKTDFNHSTSGWNPIIHMDKDKPVNACDTINILKRSIDSIRNTLASIDATVEHFDEIIDKWNTAIKCLIDIQSMVPENHSVRDALGIQALYNGHRFRDVCRSDLVSKTEQ